MFCGYACIMFAMRGDLATAAPFIGFAFVLDMLDGRIARMTNTTSAFGLEFDSLADVISFGVAPAVLAFAWGLRTLGRVGWAGGLRLRHRRGDAAGAVQHPERPGRATSATSSACHRRQPPASPRPRCSPGRIGCSGIAQSLAALAIVLVPATLMVSTIRFRSFKTLDLQAEQAGAGNADVLPPASPCSSAARRPRRRRPRLRYPSRFGVHRHGGLEVQASRRPGCCGGGPAARRRSRIRHARHCGALKAPLGSDTGLTRV